jgi:hypothetical protein
MSIREREQRTPFKGLFDLGNIFGSKKMRLKSGSRNTEKMVIKMGLGYGDSNESA